MIDAKKRNEVEVAIEPTAAILRELQKCLLQKPLKPETLREVSELEARYRRRVSILQPLVRSLAEAAAEYDALLLDGFPELPTSDDAAADLDETFTRLNRFRDRIGLPRGGRGGLRTGRCCNRRWKRRSRSRRSLWSGGGVRLPLAKVQDVQEGNRTPIRVRFV